MKQMADLKKKKKRWQETNEIKELLAAPAEDKIWQSD